MVRRGTKVGDAYIETHADNTDFVNGLDRVRRRIRKEFGEEGEQSGAWFSKQWKETVENKITSTWKDIIKSATEQDFSKQVKQWGSITEAVRRTERALEDMTQQGRAGKVMTQKQKDRTLELLYAWQKVAQEKESISEQNRKAVEWAKELNRLQGVALKDNKAFDRLAEKRVQQEESLNKLVRKRIALTEDAASRYRELFDIRDDLSQQEWDFFGNIADRQLEGIETIQTRLRRMYRDLEQQRKDQLEEVADYQISETDRVVQHVKRTVDVEVSGAASRDSYLFSRLIGSRNNLLNLVGRFLRPIENIVGGAFRNIFAGLSRSVGRLSSKLLAGGKASRALGRGLGGLARVAPALGASLAAAGAALVALWFAAGQASAALSAVAGMVVALAGSLSFALAGAIASLLPMIYALGAGIAALVVGITGMSEAQKAQLDPLTDWYDRLSNMVADHLFADLSSQVEGFLDAFGPHFESVLTGAADALSGAVNRMLDDVSSADFQNVLSTLDEHIPNIVGNLADAFSGFGRGITAVAAAIAPKVEAITEGIADVLSKWGDWASSAEGQNSIATWFDEAWESAQILWDVLTSVWDVVSQLLGMGKDTGDNWLKGWADQLDRFSEWLSSPEGKAAFEDWMNDVEDIASSLGNVIEGVGNLFDALDTPFSRSVFDQMLDGITVVLAGLTEVSKALDDVMTTITNLDTSEGRGDLAAGIMAPFEGILGMLGFDDVDISKVWPLIEEEIAKIPDKIANFFENIDWAGILQSMKDLGTDIVIGLLQGIRDALIPDSIVPMFQKVIDWVKNLFGVNSPSTVFIQIGKDLILGLIQGLLSLPGRLLGAIQSLVNSMIEGFRTKLPQVVRTGLNILDNLIPGLGLVTDQMNSNMGKELKRLQTTTRTGTIPVPKIFARGISGMSKSMLAEGKQTVASGRKGLSGLDNVSARAGRRADDSLRRSMKYMSTGARNEGRQSVESLRKGLSGLDNAAYKAGEAAENSAIRAIGNLSGGMSSQGGAAVDSLRSALSRLDNVAYNAGEAAENAAINGISNMDAGLAGVAKAAVRAVRAASGGAYSAGYSVGASVGQGMIAGMNAYYGAVYAKAAAMAKKAEIAARSALISQSPSVAMMRVGEDAVRGFIIPFENELGAVESAADRMVRSLVGRFNVNSMYNKGRAASKGLVDGLGSGLSGDMSLSGMVGSRRGGGNHFAEGAIVIKSNARDPLNAARQWTDDIADNLVGA